MTNDLIPVYENFCQGFEKTDVYFLRCCELLPASEGKLKALRYAALQLTLEGREAEYYFNLKFQQLAACIIRYNKTISNT